jgi:hypothetical protein
MSIYTPTKPVSVMTTIEERQAALGLSDQELCAAVGFDRQVVLTMIKTGAMKLPLNRVPAFANALSLEAGPLLRTAMEESSPGLLQLIRDVLDPLDLTDSEQRLIKHLRQLAGDKPTGPLVLDGKGVIALVVV